MPPRPSDIPTHPAQQAGSNPCGVRRILWSTKAWIALKHSDALMAGIVARWCTRSEVPFQAMDHGFIMKCSNKSIRCRRLAADETSVPTSRAEGWTEVDVKRSMSRQPGCHYCSYLAIAFGLEIGKYLLIYSNLTKNIYSCGIRWYESVLDQDPPANIDPPIGGHTHSYK